MNVVLVYNPRSGSAPKLKELRQLFAANSIDIDEAIAVKGNYINKVKQHAKPGQVIAVVGGDGTLSNVAHVIHGTQAIMAPLPGGTLNHFTKDLGIDQDVEKAIANLTKSKVTNVDIATVNDRVFLNNSSIGLYPSSLQTREHFEDRLGKWPAMLVGSVRAWLRYKPYQLEVNGERITTPVVFVGNNDYHLETPQKLGRTRLDEGLLSVYAINAPSRVSLIKTLLHAAIGRWHSNPDILAWKTDSIFITSHKKRLKVSRDGELGRVRPPLTYKTLPGALRVLK